LDSPHSAVKVQKDDQPGRDGADEDGQENVLGADQQDAERGGRQIVKN